MAEKISRISGRLTLDRLMALSDGVIAIAITILVLGIDIPEDHSFSQQGLLAFLSRIKHDIVVYAASFWIIAALWLEHHVIYHYVRFSNRALIWLNCLFLFSLTLIPFLTKLKTTYKQEPRIVLLFGSGFILASLVLLGMWRYASSKREVLRNHPVDPSVVRSMTQRILATPIIALVAIVVSFLDVRLGSLVFLAIPLFYFSHRIVDTQWDKTTDTSG